MAVKFISWWKKVVISRQRVNFRAGFKTSFAFGNIEKNRDKKALPFIEWLKALAITGDDPGFLERRRVCIKVYRYGDMLCWIYLIFLNIPWKWNTLASLRPNYFIFIGYFKTGGGRGVPANPSRSATGSQYYISCQGYINEHLPHWWDCMKQHADLLFGLRDNCFQASLQERFIYRWCNAPLFIIFFI